MNNQWSHSRDLEQLAAAARNGSAVSSAHLQFGGVVLCGGQSSRMGRPKAWLPIGDEVFLQRVVRTLRSVLNPVVVVAARDQELPVLAPDILIVRDEHESLGPVGGMAAGFAALSGLVHAAYVSACDVPLLNPEVIREMCRRLGDADIAIPVEDEYPHPLAAVYRLALLPRMQDLVARKRLRPVFLWDGATVNQVPVGELRSFDPELLSLVNVNTPEDYHRLCGHSGIE